MCVQVHLFDLMLQMSWKLTTYIIFCTYLPADYLLIHILPWWVIHLNRAISQYYTAFFNLVQSDHFKFNLQWAVISYKPPLLVLWVAFFSSPVPSNSRALHSHDSLFWQESTLQTDQVLLDSRPPPLNVLSPASETWLKSWTIIFLNFHPLIFTLASPLPPPSLSVSARASRFWSKKRSEIPGAGVLVFSQLLG